MIKKRSSLLFTLTLFFLSIAAKAQFEGLNLNKYKLADFKYKSLSTNLSMKNTFNYYKNDIGGLYNSGGKSRANNFNSNGIVNFYSKINNRKYIGNQNISVYGNSGVSNKHSDYYYTSIENISTKEVSNFSNVSLDINTNNRFYNSNDFFISVNLQTIFSYYNTYSRTKNETDESKLYYNYSKSINRLSLEFGKGRIEDVTDARLAIYILDDLSKQGRLSRTPNEEEVFAFADFITKLLNKRVIDSRIKRIKEYVAIDSFLVTNQLLAKTDGLSFGLINDNWNFSRAQSWQVGSDWYVGVLPSFGYDNMFSKTTYSSYTTKNRKELSEYGLGFNAGYRSNWIFGLKWQQGYSINGTFSIFKYDSVGLFNDIENYKQISGNAFYLISYIPNTRTSIDCESGINVSKYFLKESNSKLNVSPYLVGTCNYYFSEKFRFKVKTIVSYNYSDSEINDHTFNSKRFEFEFNAALSYFFF